jgi:hypothetical protein
VIWLNIATLPLLAAIGLAASGCFWRKEAAAAGQAPSAFTIRSAGNTNVVMTPAASPAGRIASINAQAKFAVISFPIGQLPANETKFAVFHGGMKVGEIRITGPAQENFTVGDITIGTAQEGDEVRAE